MQNRTLVDDYINRAQNRLAALEILHKKKSWADVVRESQEIVELVLKALLKYGGFEVPRVHDVGPILTQNAEVFAKTLTKNEIEKMASISHDLRRDRELAFYGSEDLTPSEFYSKKDADDAKTSAIWVTDTVVKAVRVGNSN